MQSTLRRQQMLKFLGGGSTAIFAMRPAFAVVSTQTEIPLAQEGPCCDGRCSLQLLWRDGPCRRAAGGRPASRCRPGFWKLPGSPLFNVARVPRPG